MSRVQGVRYWKAEELEYKTMRQGLLSLLSTFDRLQVQWAQSSSFAIRLVVSKTNIFWKNWSYDRRNLRKWKTLQLCHIWSNDDPMTYIVEKILAATPIFRKQLLYDLVKWPGVHFQRNRQTEKTWADRRDSVYIQFPSFSPNFRCTVFICTTHVYLNCTI